MTVPSPSTAAADAFSADVAARQFDGRVAITATAGVLEIVDRRSRSSGWSIRLADDGAGGVSVDVRRGDVAFTGRVSDGAAVARRILTFINDGRISPERPLPILAISSTQR